MTAGGGAEAAGLQVGDVITKVGDQKVESSDALVAAIRSAAPNTAVDITYTREASAQSVHRSDVTPDPPNDARSRPGDRADAQPDGGRRGLAAGRASDRRRRAAHPRRPDRASCSAPAGRRAIDERGPELFTPGALALRSHVLLRSRFAEDQLARRRAAASGSTSILGAGLDTFAYRQPGWAGTLRIFEVDQPASQQIKRQRLAEAGIAEPDNLTFVGDRFRNRAAADGSAPRPASLSPADVRVLAGGLDVPDRRRGGRGVPKR